MALNALQSNMVRFTGTPGITVDNVTVGYKAEYTFRTSTEQKYNALVQNKTDIALQGQYYIQLGEELYDGKLTKRFARDDFERPGYNWQFEGKDIGTYVDYTLKRAEYTEGVKGETLYDLLTYTTINENDLLRYVDGEKKDMAKSLLARSNKKDIAESGNGVLTEVFVDDLRDEVTITSISTWLAKANSDYNTSTETLSLKVYYTDSTGRTFTVDGEDVPAAMNVKKDDFVLVNISKKESVTNPEVVKIGTPEIISDASVTKFSQSGTDQTKGFFTKLTTGGTEYKASAKANYSKDVLNLYDATLLTDNTYNVYIDKYGYAVGVDLHEGTKNYVFITGYDRGTSHISVKTAEAAAIFLDGTMQVITVNVTDTNKNIDRMNNNVNDGGASGDPYFVQWSGAGKVAENRWYTYTVANNGTYTLRPVASMFATNYAPYTSYNGNTKTLDSANLYVDDNGMPGSNKGRAYGEDASVYITVDTGRVDLSVTANDAITDVKGVYTGIQDIKMELSANTQKDVPNAVYTVYDSDRYIIASIVLGEAQGGAANYAYILSDAKSERIERETSSRASGDVTYYWEFDAVLNGEKTTLTAKTKYPSSSMITKYTVQELRFDGEYVTDVKNVAANKTHTNNQTNRNIEDMYVYDVGHVAGDNWTVNRGNGTSYLDNTGDTLNGNGGVDTRINGTIYLQGRTLYSESGDVGLALARDAKAVIVQMEDDSREVTNCGSVADAIARLADRDPNAAGVQFKGRIVAVLDTRGIAQWVVLISDTELVTGNNPNYNRPSGVEVPEVTVVGLGQFLVADTVGMTDAQFREFAIQKMEAYTGMRVKSYGWPVSTTMIFDDGTAWGTQATVNKTRELAVRYDGVIKGYMTSGVSDSVVFDVPVGTYYLTDVKTGVPGSETAGKITVSGTKTTETNLYSAYFVILKGGYDGNTVFATAAMSNGDAITSGNAVASGENITITFTKAEFYTITVGGRTVYQSTKAETINGTKTIQVTGEVKVTSVNAATNVANQVKEIIGSQEYTIYYALGTPNIYALNAAYVKDENAVANAPAGTTWIHNNGFLMAMSSAMHDLTETRGISTVKGDDDCVVYISSNGVQDDSETISTSDKGETATYTQTFTIQSKEDDSVLASVKITYTMIFAGKGSVYQDKNP